MGGVFVVQVTPPLVDLSTFQSSRAAPTTARPSAEQANAVHRRFAAGGYVQVWPKSEDRPNATVIRRPSADMATTGGLPPVPRGVQLLPESLESQTELLYPPAVTAASRVPSAEVARECQFIGGAAGKSVHGGMM